MLIRHFLNRSGREIHKELSGLTASAETLLLEHSWPGNVRELEQVIHYGAVMAGSPWIDVIDLPAYLRAAHTPEPLDREVPSTSRVEAENRHVLEVLAKTGGDKHETARLLGVSRATLWRLLKRARRVPPVETLSQVSDGQNLPDCEVLDVQGSRRFQKGTDER